MSRNSIGFLLCALVLQLALASQETNPKNSETCDTSYKVDDKKRLDCRKSLSGGLECHDRQACDNLHCSDEDVAHRAGMLCDGFPHYNGGYPMSELVWDSENENYNCLQGNNASTYCYSWESIEDSADEPCLYICAESIAITGTASSASPISARIMSIPFRHSTQPSAALRAKTETTGKYADSYHYASECWDDGYSRCWYTPESEYEYADAYCQKVSSTGYCEYWTQEEYDEHNHAFREYEEYTCLQASANNQYCQKWKGNIDSEEEFEFSECKCDTEHSSTMFCNNWSCYEKGQDYFFPNLLWSLLDVIIGVLPGIIMLAALGDCCVFAIIFSSWFIWSSGFLILTTWLSGIGIVIIHFSIIGGVLATIAGLFVLC
eukprot:jgi/Bigna1/80550/fgenesh1_pg.72_\